jgi:hypothetical protein
VGTKNNPGNFDCYANANPDEPMFILLGRDPYAPALVREWADRREQGGESNTKVAEARTCAFAMADWLKRIGKTEREASGQYGWVIEMQGPAYLSAHHLGGYEFYWTENHYDAIRFTTREQADLVMMAVRQLRGDLFPSCLPRVPCAVVHKWILVR